MSYTYSNIWRQYDKSKFEKGLCEHEALAKVALLHSPLLNSPFSHWPPPISLFSFDDLSQLSGGKIQEGSIECLYSSYPLSQNLFCMY